MTVTGRSDCHSCSRCTTPGPAARTAARRPVYPVWAARQSHARPDDQRWTNVTSAGLMYGRIEKTCSITYITYTCQWNSTPKKKGVTEHSGGLWDNPASTLTPSRKQAPLRAPICHKNGKHTQGRTSSSFRCFQGPVFVEWFANPARQWWQASPYAASPAFN